MAGSQGNTAATTSYIGGPDDFARRFDVSRETLERLATYERLLKQWQKAVNLVAPSTLDDIWHRHFADSAQLAAHLPSAARRLADLGCGAGFPGLVLAIMVSDTTWPGSRPAVTLVESDQRKAAFLREAARVVEIPVDIVSTRIEASATVARIRGVDVVTARALARLERLFALILPIQGPEATLLLLKGRGAENEIEAARTAGFTFDCDPHASLTETDARVLVVRQLASRARARDWTQT
ncbi:MAG: 16S rRNA (guanine(527)-N(7))-methyltransferase RsmG [Hyphomicrobiaceae bacterium]